MLKKLMVAALLVSATASADPKFEYGKAEEVKKEVEYNAAVEAGVVFTTGNSETTTLSAGLRAARKKKENKLSIEGSIIYARSGLRVFDDMNANGLVDDEDEVRTDSTVTAESMAAKVRYDRFLTEFNSLFIAGLVARDIPAGKEGVYGGQAGYSRRLYKSEKAEAVGEFGYDYSREDLVIGSSVSIHSLRGFVGLKAEVAEGASFESSVEALTNLNKETIPTDDDGASMGQDTRINVKAAISAKIGKNLAFQTSLEAKYDRRPAALNLPNYNGDFVIEASRLDTIMKASLIYTIL